MSARAGKPLRAGLLLATLVVGACGLPLEAAVGHSPVNTCSGPSDCAEDASCMAGKCVATRYDLANLLLTVSPAAAATFGGGRSFVVDPGAMGVPLVSRAGSAPFSGQLTIGLSPPKSIRGAKVLLDPNAVPGKGCDFANGTVPAQLTFYRVPRLTGMPLDRVQVTTKATSDGNTFDIDLVADEDDRYDVYIEPQPPSGCTMSLPPYYLPAQKIDASRTTWPLPPIGTLSGTITGLTDTSEWRVELVEPSRGLPISAGSTLQFTIGMAGAQLTAQIPPLDLANKPPILRLTPVDASQPDPKPVDPTRPSVYWTLKGSAGGTTSNPTVEFTVDDLAVVPVPVQGHVLGPDGLTGVAAKLTIQSTMLPGQNGGNAAYSSTTAQTVPGDPSGLFNYSLPPGDYLVRIFPIEDRGVSITDRSLNWPASTPSCVCGVTFELDAKASLQRTLTTPMGQPMVGTTVGIAPSETLAGSYLADTHMLAPLPVRVETTTTDSAGAFSLLADLGTTDLTVQTDPATNLPWLVIPRISPGSPGSTVPLTLVLKNPGFLVGAVLDPQQQPVANAQIDAWYPVRDPSSKTGLAGTVVRIATTSTDANGSYILVLPSSI